MSATATRPRKRKSAPAATNAQMRRRIGISLFVASWLGIFWFLSPGLPVLWAPSANAATIDQGRELFAHDWTPNDPLAHGDGLGPVFNASSCVACHFQGGIGGGGGNSSNVLAYEIHSGPRGTVVKSGTVHADSVDTSSKETLALLRKQNPIQRASSFVAENHCQVTIPEFDPVRTTPIQTTAMWGVGWVDRMSSKAITSSHMNKMLQGAAKEFSLDFSSVPAGRPRILKDGRVGKFGWKAQFATLEEFVAAACSNELGLGTPTVAQANSFANPASEKVTPDLDKKQFRALVAFCDTLPRPVESLPSSEAERNHASNGKALFSSVGCAACHTPDLGGVKGVYSDFLLHTIDDPLPGGGSPYGPDPDLPPDDSEPRPSEWKTPALWGVADSAPYLHDGSARTLTDAIRRHRGDAKVVSDNFSKLSKVDQDAILAFLTTLKAPPDAVPAPDPTEVALGKKR